MPDSSPPQLDLRAAIANRRSIRRYASMPLPLADLAAVLDAMARPAPVYSNAVRVHVLTTAVQGLPSAAWAFDAGTRSLHLARLHDAAVRTAARRAGLDQDVIGEAAAVLVLAIERAAFMADDTGAARGYRHAFLEAGLVGERLYLAAAQRRLGACGVGAFYDDEASSLMAVDAGQQWIVHFAALGVPA